MSARSHDACLRQVPHLPSGQSAGKEALYFENGEIRFSDDSTRDMTNHLLVCCLIVDEESGKTEAIKFAEYFAEPGPETRLLSALLLSFPIGQLNQHIRALREQLKVLRGILNRQSARDSPYLSERTMQFNGSCSSPIESEHEIKCISTYNCNQVVQFFNRSWKRVMARGKHEHYSCGVHSKWKFSIITAL